MAIPWDSTAPKRPSSAIIITRRYMSYLLNLKIDDDGMGGFIGRADAVGRDNVRKLMKAGG